MCGCDAVETVDAAALAVRKNLVKGWHKAEAPPRWTRAVVLIETTRNTGNGVVEVFR